MTFKYCKASHTGLLSTDTDSLYMQLGASDIYGNENYEDWFPPSFCPEHKAHFVKTKMAELGLFLVQNPARPVKKLKSMATEKSDFLRSFN